MKVWVMGRGYPTSANRMCGSFEMEQAKLLARNGYDISYIALTLSFFDRKDPRGLRTFEDNGVKVYVYSHFYFPGKAGIYLERFEDKCWRMLLKKVEQKSGLPDIIHVHYPTMLSSINEIEKYREQGVKLFVTEHWSHVMINDLRKHELSRLQYYTRNAKCFVSVSEALQEAVKKVIDVRIPMEVIPNVVSPVFFDTVGKKKDDSFTFITVGRLIPLKQVDSIILQFLKEFAGNEKVKLRIIGAGTERNNLESISGDNLQITFTGELSLSDTAMEIANADALVSFSKYETFAVPVAEAWACGKPVIVSEKSGVASFVNDAVGIVVHENSQEKLGVALKRIYTEYNKYYPRLIKDYAEENFSDQAIVKRLEKMYGKNLA